MSSTSLVRSGYPRDWAGDPGLRRGGSSGGLSRFIVSVGIGVGATLGWQAYGDTAREMLAGAYPQLGWLAPRAAAAQTMTTSAASGRTVDQQLQDLTATLYAVRQRVDQLALQVAAGQDQMTRDIAVKVQAAERDILDKIAAAPARPEAAAPRKPTPQVQSSLH
jgi:hypothetical protein